MLAHPLVALPLWVASLYVWHIPALYQAALDQRAGARPPARLLHRLRGADVDAAASGRCRSRAGSGSPAKLGYVVAVRFAGTVLGNVFMWSNTVFYPDYAPGEADFGISPLSDQGTAGVIMTIEGGLITLGVMAWLFLLWAQQDTERQRLVELAEERGVELGDGRAERAVRAGQGGRLEERIKDRT